MKTILGIFCLIALLASPVQGQELKKKTDKIIECKSIKNLDEALKKAEKALGVPVLFLPSFPGDRKLYAYMEFIKGTTSVVISFSPDEKCHGVKYCSIGSMNIKKGGTPETRKDMSRKPITEEVTLKDNIKGYYTPGHPMADFWPPSLQWVYNEVLYDLWWNEGDRNMLVDMANSAILETSHKKSAY